MNRGGIRRQRGAAMVIAAVFLIVAVLVYGLVALRMAGTSVTDSALVADAAEALFLAESGLERAAQRLANGTACAALAPDAGQAFGSGDFQILSAADVGGLCRVQVVGRRLMAGQPRAQRVIEGDFTLGASGNWVVGNNGVVLTDGSGSWSTVPAFTGDDLNGIDCAGSSCLAVGDRGGAFTYDGSAWSATATGTGQDLEDVACEPGTTSACFAVGENGTALRWTTAWAATNSGTGRDLNGVYCGTGFCYVVGDNGTIRRWTGGTNWLGGEIAFSARNLNGVACLPGSATACFAVGRNGTLLQRFAFGPWGFWISVASGTGRHLNDISCPTTTFCVAVGNNGTALVWNGTSWSGSATGTSRRLRGVDCETGVAGNCLAVGNNGTILAWNGAAWSTQPSGTGSRLNDVAVASGGGGSVTLARWRERIF